MCTWIKHLGFDVDNKLITKCREFLWWYSKRFSSGIPVIQEMIRQGALDEDSLAEFGEMRGSHIGTARLQGVSGRLERDAIRAGLGLVQFFKQRRSVLAVKFDQAQQKTRAPRAQGLELLAVERFVNVICLGSDGATARAVERNGRVVRDAATIASYRPVPRCVYVIEWSVNRDARQGE